MSQSMRRHAGILAAVLGSYLAIQYLFPLLLPFLLGGALAVAAEPMVRFFSDRLRLPRALAAAVGVAMAFSFLGLLLLVACGLAFRQLQALAGVLPDMEQTIRAGMGALSGWLMDLTQGAPRMLRDPLEKNVQEFFSSGSALLEKATTYVLRLASGFLSQLPDGALAFGTGLVSSFMISAKLPRIRRAISARLPEEKLRPWLDSLGSMKTVLMGWLKAQMKLSGVTFGILTVCLLLLRIPHAPLWGFLAALVDAFPILGTGAVLVPWSFVSFVQGDAFRAFGLLGAYGAVTLTRTILEPRLVGRQLGLDPLVTLVCLYAGFRLWGILGMILAPMLAVTAAQLARSRKDP